MNRETPNPDRQKLEEVVRIVRCGHAFFVHAYSALTDAQLRTAFAYIIDVKSQFLADVTPWISTMPVSLPDADSPAQSVERIYADARCNLSSEKLPGCANGLGFGEAQLLRLTEHAYEAATDIELKRLLKAYYPQFVICREAMWRLNSRLAA